MSVMARQPSPRRRRRGQPPRKIAISLRVDPVLLNTLRRQARARGIGYQIHLHDLLAQAADQIARSEGATHGR